MWTKDYALKYITERELMSLRRVFNEEYELRDDLTELWDGGWIFYFSPVSGDGLYMRFLVEKELERCVFVGSAGIDRAIEKCYRDVEE